STWCAVFITSFATAIALSRKTQKNLRALRGFAVEVKTFLRGPFEPGGLPKRLGAVSALPGELRLGPPEVPVRRRLLVDGPQQVQLADDARRLERKRLPHRLQIGRAHV